MIARKNFSHKELQNKKTSEIKQMLKEKGILINKFEERYIFGVMTHKEDTLLNKGSKRECIRAKWTLDRHLSDISTKTYIDEQIYK